MMPSLFEKKPFFSAVVVSSFFFVALALSLASSTDFDSKRDGGDVVSWTSPVGAGISVPACASGSMSTSCSGGQGALTLNTYDLHGGNASVFADFWGGPLIWTDGGQENISITLNGLDSNRTYCAGASDPFGGQYGVECKSTPDCALSSDAPIAEAGISLDGVTFSNSITVLRGMPVRTWLSADHDVTGDGLVSRDPDGWGDAAGGVSNGGMCEWNVDLRSPGFFVQRTVANPASPTACNQGPLAKTFNDPPGVYSYDVLRITDKTGNVSNIGTVFVTVTSPVSVSLIANPPRINPGGSSILTWETTGFGPGECSIDQGIGVVAPDGSRKVSPVKTTVYTLSCSNNTDSASTRATVFVSTVPVIHEVPPR